MDFSSPHIYLAITIALSMGLSSCLGDKDPYGNKPRYLWSSCENSSLSNVYKTKLEIDNVFENDTIKMDDYEGQVIQKRLINLPSIQIM